MPRRVAPHPLALFNRWFEQARKKEPLHDAVALATSDRSGRPSVRFVLLKSADRRGFTFFTHANSAKGRALAHNPRAAMAFYWNASGRQVRISGSVKAVASAEVDAYWA